MFYILKAIEHRLYIMHLTLKNRLFDNTKFIKNTSYSITNKL